MGARRIVHVQITKNGGLKKKRRHDINEAIRRDTEGEGIAEFVAHMTLLAVS